MHKENADERDKAPQGPGTDSPATWLAEGLRRLIEQVHDHTLQEFAEQTMPILYQMGQIETKQQQSIYHLEVIRKQLEAFLANNKLLENASLENQTLTKQHYEDHVILPMVRSIFPVFDIIQDSRNSWNGNGGLADQQIMDFANAIWTQLQQFLLNYDVDIISHKPKATFEHQIMKPVRTEPTNNRDLDGLMARSLQVGLKFGKHRLLRLETVSLYKYRPSQIETVTLNERKEHDSTRN